MDVTLTLHFDLFSYPSRFACDSPVIFSSDSVAYCGWPWHKMLLFSWPRRSWTGRGISRPKVTGTNAVVVRLVNCTRVLISSPRPPYGKYRRRVLHYYCFFKREMDMSRTEMGSLMLNQSGNSWYVLLVEIRFLCCSPKWHLQRRWRFFVLFCFLSQPVAIS